MRDLFVFANLDDILIGQRLVGFVVLGVLEQHLVHVGGGILVEPVGAAEDDESDLAIAQHRQFVGFFHDAEFALIERHLFFSIGLFVFPSHCGCGQRRKMSELRMEKGQKSIAKILKLKKKSSLVIGL